ncbi:MAG: protein kinase [Gammaproteobacteria bacterium]|nr:protein kinase [Gammaproteobacteria bacterium]
MAEQLKKGSKLLWYRIESVLGRGGFGITYLATDTNLQTKVAIKEYLPADIAERKLDSYVIPKTGTDGELYRWGLTRFIEEARTLAKFKNNINIVRVHSVFEENNTAYMVMEYEQGNDLELMLRTPQYQSEKRLTEIFDAIMSGLEQVHAHNIIHRDIKPSNIYIREDGSPVLLDFGSARQHIAGKSQNMTRIMTKGYAPYEQMDENGGDQGPWTDIYAIGASLYYAIARKVPADSFSRFTRVIQKQPDPLIPARDLPNAAEYSARFLNAIDQALKFDAADRPQSIAEFRALLLPDKTGAPEATVIATPDAEAPTVLASAAQPLYSPASEPADKTRYSGVDQATPAPIQASSKPTSSVPGHTGSGGLGKGLIAGIAAAVLVLLAGGLFLLNSGGSQTDAEPARAMTPVATAGSPFGTETQGAEPAQADPRDAGAPPATDQTRRQAELEKVEDERQQAEQQRFAQQQKEQEQVERKQREEQRLAELKRIEQQEQQRLAQLQKEEEEAERKQLEEQRLAELKRLEQEEQQRLTQLQKEEAEAETKRLEEQRLAELKRIEQEEKQRLTQLQKEEEEAARKAEAARLEEQQRLAAERKQAEEKQRLALLEKQKAAAKKTNPVSSAMLQERKLQDQESDIQSVSRLFNDLKVSLSNCDTQTLSRHSKARKTSLALVQSLCKEYSKMDLSISNFQSNPKRGVASANIKIRRLTSNSGDTVLPSKSWDTLPVKTVKADGYWDFVEW